MNNIYFNQKFHSSSHEPLIPNYMNHNIIDINTGRQLFVDDYLISTSHNTQKIYHNTNIIKQPVLFPEWSFEGNVACPLMDAVIYDPLQKEFLMWYIADSSVPHCLCIAKSNDGLKWYKPHLPDNVFKNIEPCCDKCSHKKSGHNSIGAFKGCQKGKGRGSASIILDMKEKDMNKRFKMFYGALGEIRIYYSKNGINWYPEDYKGGNIGGSPWYASYNPFNHKYFFTMRDNLPHVKLTRIYRYKEIDNLKQKWPIWFHTRSYGAEGYRKYDITYPYYWCMADKYDKLKIKSNRIAGIYAAHMVPYESLMINLMSVYCGGEGVRKSLDIHVGFSRDGFNYIRQKDGRQPFIKEEKNIAYLVPTGGNLLIKNEQIMIYFIAKKYIKDKYIMSTYVAMLRRDGFCSLYSKDGLVNTKILEYNGKYLFCNFNGKMYIEILDDKDKIIKGYERDNFNIISGDHIKKLMSWKDYQMVPSGKKIKIKFYLIDCHLYSFWISDKITGESNGYIGNGGIDYNSYRDNKNNIKYEINNELIYSKIQYIIKEDNKERMIIKNLLIDNIINKKDNIYVKDNNIIQKLLLKNSNIVEFILDTNDKGKENIYNLKLIL